MKVSGEPFNRAESVNYKLASWTVIIWKRKTQDAIVLTGIDEVMQTLKNSVHAIHMAFTSGENPKNERKSYPNISYVNPVMQLALCCVKLGWVFRSIVTSDSGLS